MTTKNVLIVDDHPLFRDAFMAVMNGLDVPPATIHAAGSISEAEATLSQHEIDLVFLDLNLPDAKGFDGLLKLKASAKKLPIYIISATESQDAFNSARQFGAHGYTPKSLAKEELEAVLSTAMDGGTWFPAAPDGTDGQNKDEMEEKFASLTPTQLRVLSYLASGLLNKQIAYEMDISIATVKAHMTAIFRKLGVSNRTQAIVAMQSSGISADH